MCPSSIETNSTTKFGTPAGASGPRGEVPWEDSGSQAVGTPGSRQHGEIA